MLQKYSPKNNTEVPKLFSVLIDQAFMSITTLLTTVVLARTYSKTSYADLVLLFSITLFILGFQSAIISKPFAINLNDFNENDAKSYFDFSINLKIVFTVAIAVLFPILYFCSFEQWDTPKFFFFLFYIMAHSSYFFVRELLLSQRKTKENLYYGVFCGLAIIILLLIILWQQLQDVKIFLGTATLIYSLVALTYLIKNRSIVKIFNERHQIFWASNWKVGKWLLGSNILFHISSNLYPWLLLYLTTKDTIAIFGVLMSIAGLVNPILTALSSYLLPIFVKMNKNYSSIKTSIKKWSILFGLMAGLLILIGLFFGQSIINILFGEKYEGLGIIVLYPFINQAITVIFQPYKIALNAIKRTDVNFWILIPRSIIAVTAGYYLVRTYGLAGVFYTMLIENTIYQLLNLKAFTKIIHTNS